MFRLALTSVVLLSISAASQTAMPGNARGEVDQTEISAAVPIPSNLPEAPSAIPGHSTDNEGSSDLGLTHFAPATPVGEQDTTGIVHTVDRKFILLNALSTAALIADVETTMRDLAGSKSAELNPLFGQHPTRARLYAINLPLNALSVYISYHFKKTEPNRNLWKIGPALWIAVHTAGTINNLIVSH